MTEHESNYLTVAVIIGALFSVFCLWLGLHCGARDTMALAVQHGAGHYVADDRTGDTTFEWYTFNPDMKP